MANTLLEVRNLKKYFKNPGGTVHAVDGVSFSINMGETLGIVGESGCGKTTIGRSILRLFDITDGQVVFKGQDLAKLRKNKLRKMRPQFQMIFQDPYSSLPPRMPVGEIIGEAPRVHKIVDKKHYKSYVMGVMRDCGLQPAHFSRYPHEFSGGQRQRISIARALAVQPSFIICDEVVSALDVSIQAQIITLLKDLQRELGLTYVFIGHDLSVVRHISDNVAVMYLGKIVEMAGSEELYSDPAHPYTQALISAAPIPDPELEAERKRIILKGEVPSPIDPPAGCNFCTRCLYADDRCREEEPPFIDIGDGHFVACHLHSGKEAGVNA